MMIIKNRWETMMDEKKIKILETTFAEVKTAQNAAATLIETFSQVFGEWPTNEVRAA